jgi:chromosome segregation ATPase
MMRKATPLSIAALLAALQFCSCGATESLSGGPQLREGMSRGRSGDVRTQLDAAEKQVDRMQNELAERDAAMARAQREIEQARRSESDLRTSLKEARGEADTLRQQIEAGGGASSAAGASTAAASVARLERQLESERAKRLAAEQALNRLREETSSGPYEQSAQPDANAEALAAAQRQVEELNATLAGEREQRADLERRYEDLKAQMAATGAAAAAPSGAELGELQEEQRRVMAAIQQDLEASRRREEDLRAQLVAAQGPDADALSDQVINLQAENEALQASLDDEHRSNKELATKLEVATRVADLIFKMRSEGQPLAADILKEAGAE